MAAAPPTNDYTVRRDVAVPMRDGVTLLADHYAPTTSTPHADVFVRWSEVDARGASRNVCGGFQRLNRHRPGLLRVALDATAHRCNAGHRISS